MKRRISKNVRPSIPKPVRKTKFVVWFNNKTDRRDDEWTAVWARNKDEARKLGEEKMDTSRFFLGRVYTIQEFIKEHGRGLV